VHPERLEGAGRLHVVEPSGAVREVAGGLTLSNGMVWRAPTALLHADSLPRLVWEHRVDPSTGTVSGSSVGSRLPAAADVGSNPAALPDGVALPDGMARDVAGGTWVAIYGAAQVWRLVDGRVDAIVELPTPRVTSVALGGADGRDMLVTTAQEGMDAAALAADPWAGRLFRARVAVAGAPVARLRPNVTNP
jgi:sugar lactone lactonase YvrE